MSGWDSIDNNVDIDKQNPKNIDVTKEEYLVANLFNSEDGEKVLEILKNIAYNEKNPEQVMCKDGMNSVISCSMLLGSQNFYRKIELILLKVKKYGKT